VDLQFHSYDEQPVFLVRKDSSECIEITWRSRDEHTTLTLAEDEARELIQLVSKTLLSPIMPETWE
jgi:hypothetical protein